MPWKQENGRWIKTAVPSGPGSKPPQQGVARSADRVRPALTSSTFVQPMNALTAKFVRQPLEFMKTHPLQPANGSITDGVVKREWSIDPTLLIGMATDTTGDPVLTNPLYRQNRRGIKKLTGQRIDMTPGVIKYMSFHNAGDVSDHSGLKVQGRAGEIIPVIGSSIDESGAEGVPVYWLPWESYKITEYNIPPVPSNLVDIPEDEYPRFFLTASINGCSVFARGDAASPTVFHAGVADKIASGDAAGFWLRQLELARGGYNTAAIQGAVHKDDYMQMNPTGPNAKAVQDYIQWLKDSEVDGKSLHLELSTGYGCVFGVRYGRLWTFYLQEIINLKKIKMVKKKEVTPAGRGYVDTSGSVVFKSVEQTKGRLFGTNTTTVYTTATNFPTPLKVREFYPNAHWAGSVGGQRVAMSKV